MKFGQSCLWNTVAWLRKLIIFLSTLPILTYRSYLSLSDLWHFSKRANGNSPRTAISSCPLTELPAPFDLPKIILQYSSRPHRLTWTRIELVCVCSSNFSVASFFWEATHQLVCLPYLTGGSFHHSYTRHQFVVKYLFVSSCFHLSVPAREYNTLLAKWPAISFPAEGPFSPGRCAISSSVFGCPPHAVWMLPSRWGLSDYRYVSAQPPCSAPLLVSVRCRQLWAPSLQPIHFLATFVRKI